MDLLQAVLLCVIGLWFVPAFRLRKNSEVSVLVYGDSWGDSGPSYTMLQDMFARHGVPASVKNVAIGGTRACQWAKDPTSLAKKAKEQFPELSSGPDFVWYTLGGNDLLDSDYVSCQQGAGDDNAAIDCLKVETDKILGCSSMLLENLWHEFKSTRVVQCGYDLPCSDNECNPIIRFPYCARNVSCAHYQFSLWQNMLMDKFNKNYKMYTGINILGTMQILGGVPGVSIGHPSIKQGSPCAMNFGCVHPTPGTPASDAIGEQFWQLFFNSHIKTTSKAYESPAKNKKILHADHKNTCGDIEASRAKCMWNWEPSGQNQTLLSKCSLDHFIELQ